MKIKKFDEVDDAAEYLEEISQYEGTEQGAMWRTLSEMWVSYRDYISDDLKNALEKEIMSQVNFIYENYEMVTKERTYTTSNTSLEYKN
tara:strand:+ start:3110 stop:3376 length:267 start_codon:yes stop_codon:yes gene_type:complete